MDSRMVEKGTLDVGFMDISLHERPLRRRGHAVRSCSKRKSACSSKEEAGVDINPSREC